MVTRLNRQSLFLFRAHRTLLKYRADAIKIQQDMDDLSQQLESHAAAMMAAQKKRQSEIWMSLRYSVSTQRFGQSGVESHACVQSAGEC